MNDDVFPAVVRALERGEAAALVTIVSAQGSTPQRIGAKMLVFADGRTVGTIGGGCYENDAFGKAREALDTGRPRLVHYDLSDDFAEESGLICGGQMDVYIEPIEPSPQLYIIGGHVAFHLAPLAHEVGFKTHVLDDREKFANRERFPLADEVIVDSIPDWLSGAELSSQAYAVIVLDDREKFANRERFPLADEVIVDSIPDWLSGAELSSQAYAVIVTRGHRHDLDALRALVARDLRYVGLIGSRAKVARIYEALVAESTPAEALGRVHAPIGLDIGAITPQEIAVSIVAELIGIRHGRLSSDDASDGTTRGTTRSMRWDPKALKALS